ncbi:MAG: hypothetical protein NVS9B10_06670 [Nevskia sp.]
MSATPPLPAAAIVSTIAFDLSVNGVADGALSQGRPRFLAEPSGGFRRVDGSGFPVTPVSLVRVRESDPASVLPGRRRRE